MATDYPNGIDVFNEPMLPESTALAEAGTGGNTRNHYMHHRDLGDAVSAIQTYASLKSHDHSGDGTPGHGNKLVQANTHESADTDSGLTAIHHTLGSNPFQAAPGDHIHDYDTLVNRAVIRCTSTTRPTNPYLGLQIYEIDTNRARIWSQYTQSNIANTGTIGGDEFERVSSTDLGSDWAQVHTFNSGRGRMATPDGHTAAWVEQGNDPNRSIARRTKAADAKTITDDQIITWQTGASIIEPHVAWFTTSASNDMYFRMSDDGNSYIRLRFTYDEYFNGSIVMYGTKTGVGGEKRIGTLAANVRQAWTYWTAELIGNTMSVYCGSNFLGKIVDTNNIANKGANYRGWGIGMEAGDRSGLDALWGQVVPSNIASIQIKDATFYTGTPIWQIVPIGAVPYCRLRQSFTQKLNYNGSVIEWDTELEDNFNFFNRAASKTNIVIKEAGLYSVEAAVQWDPQSVPDVANLLFAINGVDTTVRNSAYIRGNVFSPGFSQTLYCSGKIRFSQNDVLTVKASYQVSNNLLDKIFSFFDTESKINSRLDISFIGP